MTRLMLTHLDQMTFRQGEVEGTRAQKLEYMRRWWLDRYQEILDAIDELGGGDDPVVIQSDASERVRAWWDGNPAADQTLIIWPFGEEMTILRDFEGAVGFLGGSLSAPVEIEVYLNPTFTGQVITGGTLLGTITIDNTDNSFSFATVDAVDWLIDAGDTLAAKWPNVTEANADNGAFVLYALYGHHATFAILLEGDQQLTGDDCILLEGDQQDDSDDLLLWEGN